MQNQAVRRGNHQSGNALWYILIAIALLSALTFSLTRTSDKTASNLTSEEARILAGRAARDFNEFAQAVQKVMSVNGCGENQISFENSYVDPVSTYMNSNAPSDNRCHIFKPEGAGLARRDVQDGTYDTSLHSGSGRWIFSGENAVNGVGPEDADQSVCTSNCADLIVAGENIDPDVCKQYNLLIGFNSGVAPMETDTVSLTKFTGTYADGTTASTRISTGTGDNSTSLYGVRTACFYIPGTPNNNILYYVLLSR